VANVEGIYVKVVADIKQFMTGIDKTMAKTEAFARKARAASMAVAAIGAAATAAFALSVKTAAQFQQELANTQSVANATKVELGRLRDAAEDFGRTTIFTAKQAAAAMYDLASAGLDTTEIIETLPGVIALAAATQNDLAFTSQLVTASLKQFGLATSESERIANVMAATISKTKATMDKLASSMAYIGPIASAIGMSLEETAASLGLLYDAGFEASMAATGLRMGIAQLLGPTPKATKLLAQMGLTAQDVNVEIHGLANVIDKLREADIGATEAFEIFGNRSAAAMLSLTKQGGGALRELTKEITGTDDAARMSAQQLDTLPGRGKLLLSALEGLKIEIGTYLVPALEGLTDKLTTIVNAVTNYLKEHPAVGKALTFLGSTLGIIATVLGTIGIILAPAIYTLKSIKVVLIALGVKIKVIVGFLLSIPSAIAAILVAGAALLAWVVAFPIHFVRTTSRVKTALLGIGEAITELLEQFFNLLGKIPIVSKVFEKLAGIIEKVGDKFGKAKEKEEKFRAALEWTEEEVEGVGEGLEKVGDKVDETANKVNAAANTMKDGFDGVANAVGGMADQFDDVENNVTNLTKALETYEEFIERINAERERAANEEKNLARYQKESLKAFKESAVGRMLGLKEEAVGRTKEIYEYKAREAREKYVEDRLAKYRERWGDKLSEKREKSERSRAEATAKAMFPMYDKLNELLEKRKATLIEKYGEESVKKIDLTKTLPMGLREMIDAAKGKQRAEVDWDVVLRGRGAEMVSEARTKNMIDALSTAVTAGIKMAVETPRGFIPKVSKPEVEAKPVSVEAQRQMNREMIKGTFTDPFTRLVFQNTWNIKDVTLQELIKKSAKELEDQVKAGTANAGD